MADACSLCPSYITSAVRRKVQRDLDKVNAIKKMTSALNEALSGISTDAQTQAQSAVDAIPDPPGVGILDLVAALACPLTVFVVGDLTEFSALDPETQVDTLKQAIKAETYEVQDDYENALKAAERAKTISLGQQYLQRLKRIDLTEDSYAESVTITATVKVTCPEEYEAGPYADFEEATTDFNVSGLVPSGLDSDVDALLTSLMQGEMKLNAWRSAGV